MGVPCAKEKPAKGSDKKSITSDHQGSKGRANPRISQ